ncbi:endonuclease-reverse transcriptase domain-containing protein [Hirsutella rhossiliensis]
MPHRGRLQRLSFLLAAWSPECEERKDIAQWAADKGLGLLTTPGEATHARGNTIDLAFANIPSADALIEEHLHTGSDHYTISITLPADSPRTIARPRVSSEEEMKRFEELVRAGATALPRLAVEPRGLEAGRGAVSPTQEAADAAGRRPRKNARGTPWWNDQEVQTARRELRRARCWPQEDSRLQRHARGCGMRLHLYGQHLPGIDGITVRMLRRVWNHIGEAGAFDTVLRNRLLLRLREQGWPTNLETAARATRAAGELIQWGADNGVVFDPGKTEVIHFTRPRYKGDLPSVWHGKLSFRTHVEKWAAKAMTAAGFLQNLSNTRRGIPPRSTRHAVTACVLPILYTAPMYVPSRITYLKNRIQLTLNVAMRAIAPVWCTMPIVALHRETGIPPATLLLADAQRRAALMKRHAPPQPDPTGGVDKTQAARDFHSWLRVCPEDTLIVYTDGSQSEDGACGYGYSVWLGPSEVTYGSGRVLLAEVYDAEVEGALEGFERHSRGPQNPGPAVADSRLP